MQTETHERQKINEGYGAAYHRIYSIRFPGDKKSALKAMCELQRDFNRCSPQLIARFEKLSGHGDILAKGDEFNIHITGPWNGPVRVADVSEDRIRLVTLSGHMEAGEIQFSFRSENKNEMRFEVESLARSRNMIIDFLYDKIPLAKMMQTEMWSSFCKSFAEIAADAAGESAAKISEVEILTERREEGSREWKKL